MVTSLQANTLFEYRQAIEALRSGVPNRAAVKMLKCSQPEAEHHFHECLTASSSRSNPSDNALGMLIQGDFGDGKSHLLTSFEQQALESGFVCSRVAISKETPLYNLGEVFKSAVEKGRLPDSNNRLIDELGSALDPNSDSYSSFYDWAFDTAKSGSISQIFPATLCVHKEKEDPKLNAEIEAFWAGDKITAARVNNGLRQIGQQQKFSIRAPKASELPTQRMRFFTKFVKAAGYRGWVVLLDEVELIGFYSLLQRGRSYAEIARWQGYFPAQSYPGLVSVCTISADFRPRILDIGGKQDTDYVKPKLEQSRYSELATPAEIGMRLLKNQYVPLNPLSDEDFQSAISTIREIYSKAYGWEAPPFDIRSLPNPTMRRYVRAAITEWDLLRLCPGVQPAIEIKKFQGTYAENPDLERAPDDDSPDFASDV